MPIIEKSIRLQVPAESVFQYLGEPDHYTRFCENIIEISDVQRHLQKNTKFAWVYSMMGVHSFGKAEIEVVKHNQQLNVRFWGGIPGKLLWRLQPLEEGTLLNVELDYTAPAPLLKKHSEEAIFYQNEHALQLMLTNLQRLLTVHPI